MAKKITKKERKLLNPSTQYTNSMNNGEKHIIGETIYYGKVPSYEFVNGIMMKTSKGVPFVKVKEAITV